VIVKIYKVDNSKTNAFLERIAVALEKLYPAPPDTEITDVVVDEVELAQPKDESEGLDELRKQNNRTRKAKLSS